MSNFNIINLSEENLASESVVGQANDPSLARPSIHPKDGSIYTQQVAIQRGHLVGIGLDGRIYNAFAGTGATQLKAIGFAFEERPYNTSVDVMRKELEVLLDAPVAGATPGAVAYLSDVTPGYPTATAPTATGTLVQIVGFFVSASVVKYVVALRTSVN